MEKSDSMFSVNDYIMFYDEVVNRRRFIYSRETKSFLARYRKELKRNTLTLHKGNVYFRAQLGFDQEGKKKKPYKEERMIPLPKRASEGRINPKGIPYLYLTEEYENTLFEVKAKYRTYVSIAEFLLMKDMNVIYFHKRMEYFHYGLINERAKNPDLSVWNEINLAFSRPVNHTDYTADYIPTQILAEIVKDEGFDGILYMSQYLDCYNLCLFNVNDAKHIYSKLEYVKSKYYEKDLTIASTG